VSQRRKCSRERVNRKGERVSGERYCANGLLCAVSVTAVAVLEIAAPIHTCSLSTIENEIEL
jgi:hypothetical protein